MRASSSRRALGVAAAPLGAWLALVLLARRLRQVSGPSMRPTLAPGQIVLVVPRLRRHAAPPRGSVVVVRDPRRQSRETIKRVAAVHGDVVAVDDARVVVPPGHVYVLGDDRARSTDSRTFGPVPLDLVVGRAVAVPGVRRRSQGRRAITSSSGSSRRRWWLS